MAKEPVTVTPTGKNFEVKLKRVRLSFVDVFTALQGKDQNDQPTNRFYLSTNILLDKTTDAGKAQIAALRQVMKDAKAAEWGDTPITIKADCYCLRDGEPIDESTKDEDGNGGVRKALYDGYENHMYISANKLLKAKTKEDAAKEIAERSPVQILGPRKTAKDSNGNPCFPTLKESDGLIYAGCWADVILQVYPYNASGKSHPSRINASLEAIKFVEHGPAFGAKRVDAQSAFDEEEEDEDDAAPATAGASKLASDDPFGD